MPSGVFVYVCVSRFGSGSYGLSHLSTPTLKTPVCVRPETASLQPFARLSSGVRGVGDREVGDSWA